MAIMASAKAISVAIGMPQPAAVGWFRLITKYRPAGISMPPKAAITGKLALLMEESSPSNNSRLISRPTSKKKTAIRASLIHAKML
ncbi:hypothetical protein D3C85_1731890 [compost metagenome]